LADSGGPPKTHISFFVFGALFSCIKEIVVLTTIVVENVEFGHVSTVLVLSAALLCLGVGVSASFSVESESWWIGDGGAELATAISASGRVSTFEDDLVHLAVGSVEIEVIVERIAMEFLGGFGRRGGENALIPRTVRCLRRSGVDAIVSLHWFAICSKCFFGIVNSFVEEILATQSLHHSQRSHFNLMLKKPNTCMHKHIEDSNPGQPFHHFPKVKVFHKT
jgi:hypothetical protein